MDPLKPSYAEKSNEQWLEYPIKENELLRWDISSHYLLQFYNKYFEKQNFRIFISEEMVIMVVGSSVTNYIADELERMKQAGQIDGDLYRSKSSVSIYLTTKGTSNPPQKYFRSSNHHPTYSSLLKNKVKPWLTANISIEFKEPRYDKTGKRLSNKWNVDVRQNAKGTIQSFSIDVYEYKADMLEYSDIPVIFNAIKSS